MKHSILFFYINNYNLLKYYRTQEMTIQLSQLTENTLYDQTTKTTFIGNLENVVSAFIFNFIGILGLFNGAVDNSLVISYIKQDKSLFPTKIMDDNNNISLVLKLMNDAGMIRTSTAYNNATKLLAKIKNGSLKSGIDSLKFYKDIIFDFKPLVINASLSKNIQLRDIFIDYVNDPNNDLELFASELKKIMLKNEEVATDFIILARRVKLAKYDGRGTVPVPPIMSPTISATPPTVIVPKRRGRPPGKAKANTGIVSTQINTISPTITSTFNPVVLPAAGPITPTPISPTITSTFNPVVPPAAGPITPTPMTTTIRPTATPFTPTISPTSYWEIAFNAMSKKREEEDNKILENVDITLSPDGNAIKSAILSSIESGNKIKFGNGGSDIESIFERYVHFIANGIKMTINIDNKYDMDSIIAKYSIEDKDFAIVPYYNNSILMNLFNENWKIGNNLNEFELIENKLITIREFWLLLLDVFEDSTANDTSADIRRFFLSIMRKLGSISDSMPTPLDYYLPFILCKKYKPELWKKIIYPSKVYADSITSVIYLIEFFIHYPSKNYGTKINIIEPKYWINIAHSLINKLENTTNISSIPNDMMYCDDSTAIKMMVYYTGSIELLNIKKFIDTSILHKTAGKNELESYYDTIWGEQKYSIAMNFCNVFLSRCLNDSNALIEATDKIISTIVNTINHELENLKDINDRKIVSKAVIFYLYKLNWKFSGVSNDSLAKKTIEKLTGKLVEIIDIDDYVFDQAIIGDLLAAPGNETVRDKVKEIYKNSNIPDNWKRTFNSVLNSTSTDRLYNDGPDKIFTDFYDLTTPHWKELEQTATDVAQKHIIKTMAFGHMFKFVGADIIKKNPIFDNYEDYKKLTVKYINEFIDFHKGEHVNISMTLKGFRNFVFDLDKLDLNDKAESYLYDSVIIDKLLYHSLSSWKEPLKVDFKWDILLSMIEKAGTENIIKGQVNIGLYRIISSGMLSKINKTQSIRLIRLLSLGYGKEIFGAEAVKAITNREFKERAKNFFYSIIQDTIDQYPHEVDIFYEGLDTYMKNSVMASLSGAELIVHEINNGIIAPIKKLRPTEVKQLLKANSVNFSELFATLKVRKTKGEGISSFISRVHKELEHRIAINSGYGIGPVELKIEKQVETKSQEYLDAITVELQSKYRSNNKHGDTYFKVLNVFEVKLPFEKKREEFAKALENEGIAEKRILPSFHGCGGIGASFILRYGFKVFKFRSIQSVKNAGRALGDGTYIANLVDKSQQYISDYENHTRKVGTKGYLLIADTLLGKRERDYNDERFTGFISPEWVCYKPNEQIHILRALFVELISIGEYNRIKSKVNRNILSRGIYEETRYSGFLEFLNEGNELEMEKEQNITRFIFMDGNILVKDGGVKWYEDLENGDLGKDGVIELSGEGPMVTFYNTKESITYIIPYATDIFPEDVEVYKSLIDR